MIRPEAFHFHNGRSARSAADLAQVLEEGPESLYADHVTAERNDFASWAQHALGEPVLAARLREARSRESMLAAIHEWLEPHMARSKADTHHQRTDFLLGFGLGLVVGILVAAVVAMLA
jgi:hypothetical protein